MVRARRAATADADAGEAHRQALIDLAEVMAYVETCPADEEHAADLLLRIAILREKEARERWAADMARHRARRAG